jgi:glycerophosphoryl diester phosphodiesterase
MRTTSLALAALFLAQALAFAQTNPSDAAGAPRQHRIDARTPQGLQALFQPASEPLPFVSAHRGGPRKGFPENCIATFEDTLAHTFAIMEIDPRYAKDGAIVLHHDATLERTTTGTGKVADFTLAELKRLRLKDPQGDVTEFQIPTLDEALEWARGRTILVLDQKDVPATERVKRIAEHKAEAYAMVIVNTFKDAQACRALNVPVMMEVMIPNRGEAEEFDALGIPWSTVVAFVGHTPPEDLALYEFIHRKGAACMIGTSRHLDRRVIAGEVSGIKEFEPSYRAILRRGADIIETDIPTLLGPLLHGSTPLPASKRAYLLGPSPAESPGR